MKGRPALVLAAVAALLVVAPGLALDRIPPGFDLWVTPADGTSYTNFANNPIPAGFFCPGSAPFAGQVGMKGVPVAGIDRADTIVERIDEAVFGADGSANTRLRVKAIQLESIRPIQTSCGAFNVRASLAGDDQPVSQMKLKKSDELSGTFESQLALRVRLTFVPVGRAGKNLKLVESVLFNRSAVAPWVAVPGNAKGLMAATIDTNGDGKVETRISGSPVFFAGATAEGRAWWDPVCHCAAYDELGNCSEEHCVEPCECCNLPPGMFCP